MNSAGTIYDDFELLGSIKAGYRCTRVVTGVQEVDERGFVKARQGSEFNLH